VAGRDHAGTFDDFVAARYAALVRSATLLCGDHHDAEDLVQGALVKAVGVWHRIGDDPEPYVRRIMVNDNISRWRKHRGRVVVREQVPDTDTAPASDSDTRLDVEAALATLPPRQRTVVVLRYLEDLSERQTADLMGTSVGTVKSQARDALAALRRVVPDLTVHRGAPDQVAR